MGRGGMAMPARWTRGLRPDQSVLELVEDIKGAAVKGEARVLHVTMIAPDLRTHSKGAGDMDHTKAMLLAAALIKAAQEILAENP